MFCRHVGHVQVQGFHQGFDETLQVIEIEFDAHFDIPGRFVTAA